MVYGWGSELFQRHQAFYEVNGVGRAKHAPGDIPVSVKASYHKKREYIWFGSGRLNCF